MCLSLRGFVRLFFAALGFSLAVFWARSRATNEVVIFTTPGHHYVEIATIPDQFRVTVVDHWPMAVPLQRLTSKPLKSVWPVFGQGRIYSRWFPLGVALTHGSRYISPPTWGPTGNWALVVTYSEVAVPFGLAVGVCAIIAFWPLLRSIVNQRRGRARVAGGFCPQCGYDLRASSERCPECGRGVGAGELDFEKSGQSG